MNRRVDRIVERMDGRTDRCVNGRMHWLFGRWLWCVSVCVRADPVQRLQVTVHLQPQFHPPSLCSSSSPLNTNCVESRCHFLPQVENIPRSRKFAWFSDRTRHSERRRSSVQLSAIAISCIFLVRIVSKQCGLVSQSKRKLLEPV
jgi:hypothetical protein